MTRTPRDARGLEPARAPRPRRRAAARLGRRGAPRADQRDQQEVEAEHQDAEGAEAHRRGEHLAGRPGRCPSRRRRAGRRRRGRSAGTCRPRRGGADARRLAEPASRRRRAPRRCRRGARTRPPGSPRCAGARASQPAAGSDASTRVAEVRRAPARGSARSRPSRAAQLLRARARQSAQAARCSSSRRRSVARQLAVGLQVQPFAVGAVIRPVHDAAPRSPRFNRSRKSCSFSLSICRPRKSLFLTVPRGIRLSWAISS